MQGWHGHALLGKRAVEVLPDWEKESLKPDMSDEAVARPFMPAGIKTPCDRLAAMCLILDWVYQDEYRSYCLLPDGRWIPHTLVDEDYSAARGNISLTANVALIAGMMEKMVTDLRRGECEEAIRHGGVLGHFLQEPFTPGHAVDNALFHELFPDPDPERHLRLHYAFDSATDRFDSLPPPRLMGLTSQEAAFNLLNEIRHGIRKGKELIMPVVQAAYRGEDARVFEDILSSQSRSAAFVTASAWHTAFCIAFGRFEPAEISALDRLQLVGVRPYFWHPCDYTEMIPGRLVRQCKKVPMDVWTRDAHGVLVQERIENGFGMYGHFGAKFFVNGDVYTRFRCRIGLPSRHTEGQDEHTNVVFSVEADETENQVYSEDIEYGARRLIEIPLHPGEPVKELDVDIAGARTLLLCARSLPYTNAEGLSCFSVPHIAVCEPELVKG